MTDLKLARVARGFEGVEPCDQLRVEVAASGQRPATDAVEDLTAESQTGVGATGGVLLLQTSGVTSLPGPGRGEPDAVSAGSSTRLGGSFRTYCTN